MDDVLVGVDLGGTSIKFGVGTSEGELLQTRSIPTDAHEGPQAVIQRIISTVDELARQTAKNIRGIGVGAPGLIDVKTGTTRFLPNLPTQWKDVGLGKPISNHFACPVLVANDARTATLGELRFGYGRQQKNLTLAFFTLGTGVGGGVAIEGKLRLGKLGAAGELGHQTIEPNGLRCGCGNIGCLETIASGPAILGQAVRLMRSGQAPRLHEICNGDVGSVTIENLIEAVEKDDAIAEVIERAAQAIGIASANVVTSIHPDLIVLGGGVAEIGSRLTEVVKKEITRRVQMFPTDNVEVVKSQLGVQAGILGAVALGLLATENGLTIH